MSEAEAVAFMKEGQGRALIAILQAGRLQDRAHPAPRLGGAAGTRPLVCLGTQTDLCSFPTQKADEPDECTDTFLSHVFP